jgi:hypothetical protein
VDSVGDVLTSQKPFRVRFPGLVDAAHLTIDALALAPARDAHGGYLLVQWLDRHAGPRIADLLEVTEEDVLEWRNIGVGKRDQILGFLAAVDASRDVLTAESVQPSVDQVMASMQTDPDLLLLLDWAGFVGPRRSWGDIEEAVLGQGLPLDVAEALSRLRARRVPARLPAPDAEQVLAEWVDAMEPRDRDILQHRLVMAPLRTLEDIGAEHGVTRERIRQVQRRLTDKVPGLLASDEWRPVRWEVFAQRHRLGACAPLTTAESELLSSAEGFPRALILWLAGYVRADHAVSHEDFPALTADTVPFVDDTPVVDQEALAARLIAEGVHAELVDWAVDQVPGLARVDGEVVLWPGNIVEKSYAVLCVRGASMTPDALAEAIGGGISVRGLRSRLYDDDRICRVSAREVGLVAWGGEEYTSVPSLMTTYLEEHGRSEISDLQDDLEKRFDASRASIAMVRAAPVFANRGSQIWLRGPEEPFVPRATPHVIPGHYRCADQLFWRFKADRELMRGSGRATPHEIATFVGLQPGARTAMRAQPHDIHFAWLMTSHVGPQMGSLKALTEAAGVNEGDDVLLVLDRAAHTASVKRLTEVTAGEVESAALRRLTGLPAHACSSLETLAACVGVAADQVIDALSDRGDVEAAALASRLPS